jgi:hypothetical protein
MYLFKRLTAVLARRFYRLEHIVSDSSEQSCGQSEIFDAIRTGQRRTASDDLTLQVRFEKLKRPIPELLGGFRRTIVLGTTGKDSDLGDFYA